MHPKKARIFSVGRSAKNCRSLLKLSGRVCIARVSGAEFAPPPSFSSFSLLRRRLWTQLKFLKLAVPLLRIIFRDNSSFSWLPFANERRTTPLPPATGVFAYRFARVISLARVSTCRNLASRSSQFASYRETSSGRSVGNVVLKRINIFHLPLSSPSST